MQRDPANVQKKDLNGYISLQDRKSKTKYQLDDDGIILTEKAASLLGVKKRRFDQDPTVWR